MRVTYLLKPSGTAGWSLGLGKGHCEYEKDRRAAQCNQDPVGAELECLAPKPSSSVFKTSRLEQTAIIRVINLQGGGGTPSVLLMLESLAPMIRVEVRHSH